MWVIAGVLLGSALLASLVGLHVGPHAHAVAVALGLAAAAFLVVMMATGHASIDLALLLGADVAMSIGTGSLAWKGLRDERRSTPHLDHRRLAGSAGVALSDLRPSGVVQVAGETWSATSLGSPVRRGATVHVDRVDGVRLVVVGDDDLSSARDVPADLFVLGPSGAELPAPQPTEGIEEP